MLIPSGDAGFESPVLLVLVPLRRISSGLMDMANVVGGLISHVGIFAIFL